MEPLRTAENVKLIPLHVRHREMCAGAPDHMVFHIHAAGENAHCRIATRVAQRDFGGAIPAHGKAGNVLVLGFQTAMEQIRGNNGQLLRYVTVIAVGVDAVCIHTSVAVGHYDHQILVPYQQFNETLADIGRMVISVAVQQVEDLVFLIGPVNGLLLPLFRQQNRQLRIHAELVGKNITLYKCHCLSLL